MKVEEFYLEKKGLKLVLTWKYSDLKKKMGFNVFVRHNCPMKDMLVDVSMTRKIVWLD